MALQDSNTSTNGYELETPAFNPDFLWGMTFTTNTAYDITSCEFRLKKKSSASPGTLTVNLYATSTGLPTGGILSTGNTDGGTLSTDVWENRNVSMSAYNILSGVQYALVVDQFESDSGDGIKAEGSSVNPYAGGTLIHDNIGGMTIFPDHDLWFKVFGDAAGGSPPTKAENPVPTDANDSVTLDLAAITWDDGGGADTFNVYYGTVSGNLTLVSATQAGESFTVTGITDGSPYEYLSVRYWRIDSTNGDGTTTGDEWSFTTIRLNPPTETRFYVTTGQYYRLLVQSDGSYGDPPGVGVENTDYVYLAAGYEANFISTNRRLVAVAENRIWYEDL